MQEYLDCKFVSVVPDNEIPTAGKTWYVPHHCVSTSSKFRIVFDCSAKYQGTSLNDNLLQGPDLTNSLVGVFLRFRQEPIALVGDIKSMFYQVFVSEQDRDALRFLWYPDGDLEKAPVDHRMNVHVFGSTSSPSAAAFALRRVAEDNASNVDPFVIETVLKNFYVDDLCKSCSTVNEAVELLDQLCRLLKNGGFHLTKFFSNSKDVLRCIPPENLASSVAGSCDRELPTQKALGVYWNAETDKLEVKVSIRGKPCTRRGLLSMIGQTYDPLGLLQPFLLPARRVLQQACRAEMRWDELILASGMGEKEWNKWLVCSSKFRNCFCPKKF